jgi:GAF domain-containing protein
MNVYGSDEMSDPDVVFFESGLRLIKGQGDLKTALATFVHLIAEDAKSTAASIYAVDAANQVLKPLVTLGLPQSYVKNCGDIPIGEQCCGRAVALRKPWIVADMLSDPLFESAQNAALESPIRAAFSVPIIDDRNHCLGSLACHYSEAHTPPKEAIKRNEEWARLLAHAISQYKANGNGRGPQPSDSALRTEAH